MYCTSDRQWLSQPSVRHSHCYHHNRPRSERTCVHQQCSLCCDHWWNYQHRKFHSECAGFKIESSGIYIKFIKDIWKYGKPINLWIIIVCISILNFPGTYLLWINWRLSCPEFLHGTEHQWCHQCHPGSASRQPASELLLGEILTLAILFSS